jgi:hypothetical protein
MSILRMTHLDLAGKRVLIREDQPGFDASCYG